MSKPRQRVGFEIENNSNISAIANTDITIVFCVTSFVQITL